MEDKEDSEEILEADSEDESFEPEISENLIGNLRFEELDEEEPAEAEDYEEPESIESVVERPFFRKTTEQINPFLEQGEIQPALNLEKNILDSQTKTTQEGQMQNQAEVYNAPQYGSGYDTESYQEFHRQADIQRDISKGALITREAEIPTIAERRIDFNRWQQTNTDQFGQQERYRVREPERIEQETKLPFEKKKDKKLRF